jgi:hypothetical protein
MKYTYDCKTCQSTRILDCRVISRDEQLCPECNNKLERKFEMTNQIVIPNIFSNKIDDHWLVPTEPGFQPVGDKKPKYG